MKLWPFKKKPVVTFPAEENEKKKAPEWLYLGFLELVFFYTDEKTGKESSRREIVVSLYADWNNEKNRKYTINPSGYYTPDYVTKNHPYVYKYLIPWSKGDGQMYDLITKPSNELEERVLAAHNMIYDSVAKKWKKKDIDNIIKLAVNNDKKWKKKDIDNIIKLSVNNDKQSNDNGLPEQDSESPHT